MENDSTSTVNLAEEEDQLSSKLDQVYDQMSQKIEELEKYAQEQEAFHAEQMNIKKEQMSEIENIVQGLNEKKTVDKKAMVKRVEKLSGLKGQLDSLQKEVESILQEREVTQLRLIQLEEKMKLDQELIQQHQHSLEESTTIDRERACALFRDRLGYEFKTAEDGAIQVIFTCIDSKDPDKRFIIKIKIDDRVYHVLSCDPEIPDISELTKKVNETNDFSKFICTVRNRFKKQTQV